MSNLRNTSTLNIKPGQVNATNVIPAEVSTIQYARYLDPDTSKVYGEFVYGAKTYGESTSYSVGQKMPSVSTAEV